MMQNFSDLPDMGSEVIYREAVIQSTDVKEKEGGSYVSLTVKFKGAQGPSEVVFALADFMKMGVESNLAGQILTVGLIPYADQEGQAALYSMRIGENLIMLGEIYTIH